MKISGVWVLLGAVLGGCSSDDTSTGGGVCSARSGSYLLSVVEKSGNCGAMPDEIVTIGASSDASPELECKGDSTATTDNCSVTFSTVCTYKSGEFAGQVMQTKGTMHWTEDGSAGTGTMQWTISGPMASLNCSSVYAATYRRN